MLGAVWVRVSSGQAEFGPSPVRIGLFWTGSSLGQAKFGLG